MSKVSREDGETIVQLGHIRVRTDLINRYRYNDLRKKDRPGPRDVVWALKESKKGFLTGDSDE